ncbi:uncharacterized protein SOCE26_001280 [Sorangium cellulosum]|uniref:Protein kinase domain-containing protein n=1 Tax=Sorangium cellulosum TaxID=56 RepID=A0A2L0EHH5_SORCE|nr:uncharacterized protein SOCE26_001280 [Sorangium cellulosum]
MLLNFHEGTLFAGRYRVVRSLATGAMGAVYEVIHVETERRRALKVMHPHLAATLRSLTRRRPRARSSRRCRRQARSVSPRRPRSGRRQQHPRPGSRSTRLTERKGGGGALISCLGRTRRISSRRCASIRLGTS